MSDYANDVINMSRFGMKRLSEGSDDGDGSSAIGFNRHSKLMSPATRALVLKSRQTEIEAFAEDRGYQPQVIAGIAEAVMRLGRVPELRQYGFSGDDAKAIKHFMSGEILNLAIEDVTPEKTVAESTASSRIGAQMRLGSAFLARGPIFGVKELNDRAEEQKALKIAPRLGCDPGHKSAYTMEDLQAMGEGLDGKGKKSTKLSKTLRGEGKKITSPAERVPGEFDHANGGTAGPPMTTSTPASKRVAEDDVVRWRPGRGLVVEGKSGPTRKEMSKKRKAAWAKMSPQAKKKYTGDSPEFMPEEVSPGARPFDLAEASRMRKALRRGDIKVSKGGDPDFGGDHGDKGMVIAKTARGRQQMFGKSGKPSMGMRQGHQGRRAEREGATNMPAHVSKGKIHTRHAQPTADTSQGMWDREDGDVKKYRERTKAHKMRRGMKMVFGVEREVKKA